MQQWHGPENRPLFMVDDAPDVCDEMDDGRVKAYRILAGNQKRHRHKAGADVYKAFPYAINAALQDLQNKRIPLSERP